MPVFNKFDSKANKRGIGEREYAKTSFVINGTVRMYANDTAIKMTGTWRRVLRIKRQAGKSGEAHQLNPDRHVCAIMPAGPAA